MVSVQPPAAGLLLADLALRQVLAIVGKQGVSAGSQSSTFNP